LILVREKIGKKLMIGLGQAVAYPHIAVQGTLVVVILGVTI